MSSNNDNSQLYPSIDYPSLPDLNLSKLTSFLGPLTGVTSTQGNVCDQFIIRSQFNVCSTRPCLLICSLTKCFHSLLEKSLHTLTFILLICFTLTLLQIIGLPELCCLTHAFACIVLTIFKSMLHLTTLLCGVLTVFFYRREKLKVGGAVNPQV